MTINNFHPADPPEPGTFACVHPGDTNHNIYLDDAFDSAPPQARIPKQEH